MNFKIQFVHQCSCQHYHILGIASVHSGLVVLPKSAQIWRWRWKYDDRDTAHIYALHHTRKLNSGKKEHKTWVKETILNKQPLILILQVVITLENHRHARRSALWLDLVQLSQKVFSVICELHMSLIPWKVVQFCTCAPLKGATKTLMPFVWVSWGWDTWKVRWTIVKCCELEFEYCPIHHHTGERLTVRPYTGRYPAHPRHPSSSPYSSSWQPQPANSFSKSWYTWR